MADVEARIQALLPELIRLRHDLDQQPELAYEEHETAARIVAELTELPGSPADRDTYPTLHQPDYDFHDGAIADGVAMHVELARRLGSEGPQTSRAGAA